MFISGQKRKGVKVLKMVSIVINGKEVEVPAGSTVLQAAEMVGIDIPRVCYDPDLSPLGACRMCVVELKVNCLLTASGVTTFFEGRVFITESEAVF